jgi:hypothetical protein
MYKKMTSSRVPYILKKSSYRETDAIDPSFLDIHADLYRQYGIVITVGGSGFEETGTAKISRCASELRGN